MGSFLGILEAYFWAKIVKKRVQREVLGSLGGLLGSFWETLGPRREGLGTLGGSWRHLGDLLGVFWGCLGASWRSVGGSWESLGGPLGLSWVTWESILGSIWSKHAFQ